MNNYQYLLEIDALNESNVLETLHFCCQPGFSGGGGPWSPCIVDPGLIQIDLFSGGKTTGKSSYSYGEVILGNFKGVNTVNGPRDSLKGYQFYGRPVRMYVGLMTASFPSGFTKVYTATVEKPDTNWDTFSLTLRGRQAELNVPISSTRFLGNNNPPDGLEGEIELKDTLKPFLLGRGENVTPIPCNKRKLIYAVSILTGLSVNEMGSNIRVRDNGVEYYCAGIVSLSTLLSTQPPRGQYYACVDGYIRLGSTPIGPVTVSGCSNGHALTSHPVVLVTDLLSLTGFHSGDSKEMLDSNSFSNYSDKLERGVFGDNGLQISDVIDSLVAPSGYWYFTPLGILRFGVLRDPVGRESESVYYLKSDVNIESFTVEPSQDTTGGVPAKSVGIKYNRNYTKMINPAGSVPVDFRKWLAEDFVTAVKPSTNTVHPLSEDMLLDTNIISETTSPLALLYDLYTVKRELINIDIVGSEFLTAMMLLPDQIVQVDLLGRFGYSGKPVLIDGITINFVDEKVSLRLWS
jgi:hypothetical protein